LGGKNSPSKRWAGKQKGDSFKYEESLLLWRILTILTGKVKTGTGIIQKSNMQISSIFSNQRYKTATIVAGILTLAYSFINLFNIGGNDFVYSTNNNITIPLSIITTLFAFSLWNLVRTGMHSRLLWGGLLLGWALWTIAEILWVVYGFIYQEVPYPSQADFFWLIGYIPMGYGLYSRSREIPAKLSQMQKVVLWSVSSVTVLITVIFILLPVIQANDTSNWLESALNIIYPLVDLFLLIIVMRLIFIYGGGDYGFGWNLLTAGFILHSISNLIFSYASLWDTYYPDLKVNFISSVGIDMPYNLSYLLWLLGLYALRLVLGRHKPFESITQPRLVPNTSVLIFLRDDNTVFETSDNIHLVSATAQVKGTSLAELLHIPQQDARHILDIIHTERKITDHPVSISDRPGILQEAYLSGIATISANGEYSGCNLVMRILVENDYKLDETLTKEQKFMVAHLRKISGSSERDQIRKLLLDYHLAYLKQMYNLAYQTGGARLSISLMERLQQVDREHQWHLQFDPETLINNADYQISLVREALPILVEESRQFASQLTDPDTVEAEMQSISSQFHDAVHKNVEFYR
jgi:hypothetical protein